MRRRSAQFSWDSQIDRCIFLTLIIPTIHTPTAIFFRFVAIARSFLAKLRARTASRALLEDEPLPLPALPTSANTASTLTQLLVSADAGAAAAARDAAGRGPLHWVAGGVARLDGAARDAHYVSIRMPSAPDAVGLVDQFLAAGALPNVRDARGRPPLFYALEAGAQSVASALLDAGAVVGALDSRGNTVFHFCALGRSIVGVSDIGRAAKPPAASPCDFLVPRYEPAGGREGGGREAADVPFGADGAAAFLVRLCATALLERAGEDTVSAVAEGSGTTLNFSALTPAALFSRPNSDGVTPLAVAAGARLVGGAHEILCWAARVGPAARLGGVAPRSLSHFINHADALAPPTRLAVAIPPAHAADVAALLARESRARADIAFTLLSLANGVAPTPARAHTPAHLANAVKYFAARAAAAAAAARPSREEVIEKARVELEASRRAAARAAVEALPTAPTAVSRWAELTATLYHSVGRMQGGGALPRRVAEPTALLLADAFYTSTLTLQSLGAALHGSLPLPVDVGGRVGWQHALGPDARGLEARAFTQQFAWLAHVDEGATPPLALPAGTGPRSTAHAARELEVAAKKLHALLGTAASSDLSERLRGGRVVSETTESPRVWAPWSDSKAAVDSLDRALRISGLSPVSA